MDNWHEQWIFTLSVIFLTGLLGGVTGLLVGLTIFSKMCPAQFPLFSQVEPTATLVTLNLETPTWTLTPPPTLVPPTATSSPLPPSPTATDTPSPSPTITPTLTRVFTPPRPTPTIPPGIYVTNLRTDPSPAKQKQDLTFYVTFLNTTGAERTYRWFLFLYEEGQSNPVGQTSSDKEYVIPPGTIEQVSINTWRYGPGRPCANYTAKVVWAHQDGSKPVFSKVGGQEAAFPFMLCP